MKRGELVEHERAERFIRWSVFALAASGVLLMALLAAWLVLRELPLMAGIAGEQGDALQSGASDTGSAEGDPQRRMERLTWMAGLFAASILALMLLWARLINRHIAAVLQSLRYRLRDARQGLLNQSANQERRVREETERRVGMLESAIVDELTGLSNRWHFDWLLEQELRRARRSGQPLVLAMVDVDGMHEINQRHGQAAGDRILVRVAGILRAAAQRAGDAVARHGGDEFALVMPETTMPGALEVVFTIREHLAELGSLDPEDEVDAGITLSFGLAVAESDPQRILHELVEAAQRALARARTGAGGGVEVAG